VFLIGTWSWFSFWLILHILSVVVGLGSTFAFPIIGAYAGRHPEAGVAVVHIGHEIESRIILPVAALIPLFGTALIFSGHYDLWKSEWLIISIALFIIAYAFAAFVQHRNQQRLMQIVDSMPPGPPPPGASGPPPEIAALTRRLQLGGMFLTLMIVVIVVLMVWRPGSCQFGTGSC
jgi:hypothetical protein